VLNPTMHISTLILCVLPFGLGAAVTPEPAVQQQQSKPPLSLVMLDSIISRQQGLAITPSVKTSVIEAGLLLMGINDVLENVALSYAQKTKYETYLELVMSSLVPKLVNVAANVASPLDLFSVGTEFIKQ